MTSTAHSEIAVERHYSVQQVAELLSLSENTVRRCFEDYPGVLKIARRRLSGRGRSRITLRIPESILQRFREEHSGGFGGSR